MRRIGIREYGSKNISQERIQLFVLLKKKKKKKRRNIES